MKLIRLTTEDSGATFDCDFNDGINIEPNSKMAVQCCSANLGGGTLTIDNDNNRIIVQIMNGYVKILNLTPFEYNAGNAANLLQNIADTLNKGMIWEAGFNKILGIEWNCALVANTANVTTQYKVGVAGEYPDSMEIENTVLRTVSGGKEIWGLESVNTPSNSFSNCALSNSWVSKGNGFIRGRVAKNTYSGAVNTSGFIIGLTNSPVETNLFAEHNVTYAIYATAIANGTLEYYTYIDGIKTLSTVVPSAVVPDAITNDTLEVSINGTYIEYNVYQAGGAATNLRANLGGVIKPKDNLYPFMVFFGDRTNTSLNSFRWTPSPFQGTIPAPPTNSSALLGAPAPPQPPNNRPTPNFLQFQTSTVANYLGYNHARIPEYGYQLAKFASYVAENEFSVGLNTNGFLIQLLNMSIDSYDSLKQQRENLLAVIPSVDFSGDLNYSPPTPYFIDLLNASTLNIRNIKARIVRTDYSKLSMAGTGMITLLIQ